MTAPLRIAYLADDLLFPTNSGGRLELLGAARALAAAGHDLNLVITHRDSVDIAAVRETYREFPSTIFGQRPGLIAATLRHPLWPYQLSSRALRLPPRISHARIDVVIAHHEYTIPLAATIARDTGATVILRSHNDEVAYLRSLVRFATGPKKIYLLAELLRLQYVLRTRLLSQVDAVALISDTDQDAYAEFTGPVATIPPSLVTASERLHHTPPPDTTIGFLGALDSSHTEQGLAWFVRQVLPRIRQDVGTARLLVAGRRASTSLVELLQSSPGVDYLGEIDDPDALYRQSRIFVNPIFSGSGINMKLGAPAQLGIPIVSTSFGVRGLPSLANAVDIADDEANFAARTAALLRSDKDWQRQADRAARALSQQTPTAVANAFAALIEAARIN